MHSQFILDQLSNLSHREQLIWLEENVSLNHDAVPITDNDKVHLIDLPEIEQERLNQLGNAVYLTQVVISGYPDGAVRESVLASARIRVSRGLKKLGYSNNVSEIARYLIENNDQKLELTGTDSGYIRNNLKGILTGILDEYTLYPDWADRGQFRADYNLKFMSQYEFLELDQDKLCLLSNYLFDLAIMTDLNVLKP